VIVGVIPALQSTGRRVQAEISNSTSGRGMRLGKAWTALIVTQVAAAVGLLPSALALTWSEADFVAVRPAYAAKEFLRAQLVLQLGMQPGADSTATSDSSPTDSARH
jgi:hypothetical protein